MNNHGFILQDVCTTASEICCTQEQEKSSCQQGIELLQSGQNCPVNIIPSEIQNGLRGQANCINNNMSTNNTLKECCIGCRMGQIYKTHPSMCTSIASNLTNIYFKQSFLECCNVTQQNTSGSSLNENNVARCPSGFAFNSQGWKPHIIITCKI